MKPPPFAYVAPDSIDDCLAVLADHGGDAKIIAGGQSLMPLLNLRMLRPAVIVDIGRARGLDRWQEDGAVVRIGANVRQRALEVDTALGRLLPLMAEAIPLIGHPATRSRGTIVGSMCHADPAAELPVCAVLLGAKFVVRARGGDRIVEAADFFVDALSTTVKEEELVAEVRVPVPGKGAGYAFAEIARRHGDFALVSVAAIVEADAGGAQDARVALGGVGRKPVSFRLDDFIAGGKLDRSACADFGCHVASRIEPESDLHATADYRRSIAAILVERTLCAASDRATPRS